MLHEREGSHATGDRLVVDQRALQSSLEHVDAVLRALPNDNKSFPDRSSYIAVGYAVKAAVGEEGWPIFRDWAMKWPGNERFPNGNTEAGVRRDWKRFKGPFEIGVDYLDSLHRQFCPVSPDMLSRDFDGLPADTPADAPAEKPKHGPVMFSDAHLANVLAERHGKHIRYAVERREWYAWDGTRWQRDVALGARRLAGDICLEFSRRALETITKTNKAESMATKLASLQTKKNVLDYGADNPALQAWGEAFDTNPRWLNTPAGVVDLTTGIITAGTPEMMQSRMTAVAPKLGRAPRWEAFLDEATHGDKELQAYLQRLAGYALTGETNEACVAFLYGAGGNGKSVFLDTMMAVIGDYGRTSAASTFTASKSDRHSVEIADLAGARMVVANETKKNQKWDEERIKSLTGGGKITARFLYGQPFEFTPQFTLIFAGNDMPDLDGLDPAMRRRLHIVPFTNKPKNPNRNLAQQLVAEYPQILQWMIVGAMTWAREGLGMPSAVKESTAEYFDDQDPFSRWAEAQVELVPCTATLNPDAHETARVSSRTLFDNWAEWCAKNRASPGKVNGFSRRVSALPGVQRFRTTEDRGFSGLRLKVGYGSADSPAESWA